MELGIGMFGDVSKDKSTGIQKTAHQRIKELIEEIKLADEIGLDVFGMGEHHREDYAVSSPEMILAAAASVTKNIKLASAVTVLSSADPVKVYEDFATLDLLSDGRAEIMVGRGSFIESFPLYGYHLSDYNQLFTEKLDLLLNINKNEVVTWNGKLRAPLHNQRIFPRALNEGLDIWIAVGGTPESVIRAARLGLPLIIAIIGGYPYQFQPLVRLYKEEYAKHGHDASKMRIGVHSHTFVGENSQQTADDYFPYYADQMDRIGKDRGWPPFRKEQFEAGRQKEGALLIGDPSEVTDKILYLQEMFGLTRFVAHIDVGGAPHNDIMKAIELFGTRVAPEVKKAVAGR
ncbi:LLM class flavin-dependent oxidoreductase [Pseudoxanthomonas sp. SGD-10]|nr:LLM class flavin-dependent oxidoreductase [Pseudoxanthomonas sp. SGD-10]